MIDYERRAKESRIKITRKGQKSKGEREREEGKALKGVISFDENCV